jgi:RNA polymerase sigma factor (sigma-70 family)
MSENDTRLTTSDETLIANARSGDQAAFAELWRRHFRSGARVARQFTSSIDADDLVSEAYTRIYQRVLAGGGPTGAFRPYLYTTIRNLASTWGKASRDVQVDDIQDFEDPTTIDDPAAVALDRTLTARAFRSLPERWQSVLWYTEVEGMDPHEVAPVLGMSANGVAALSYRAREGLRKAWLQAHVSEAGVSENCKWTMSRLGDNARNGLSDRDNERVQEHLKTCAKCSIVSEEVEEVGSHLALVMIPILLGGVAGGALLAATGHAGAASAATAAAIAIPAAPASFAVLGASATIAPAVATGLSFGAATGASFLVGSLAVAATISGGVAFGLAPVIHHSDSKSRTVAAAPLHSVTHAAAQPAVGSDLPASGSTGAGGVASTIGGATGGVGGLPDTVGSVGGSVGDAVGGVGDTVGSVGGSLGDAVGGTVGSVVGGATGAVGGAVSGVGGAVSNAGKQILDPIIGSGSGHSPTPTAPPVAANVTVNLSGKGVPGATVTAKVNGKSVGTVKVASNGTWSLTVAGLPASTGTLQLQQRLVVLGIAVPLDIPLSLTSGAVGIVIQLLN